MLAGPRSSPARPGELDSAVDIGSDRLTSLSGGGAWRRDSSSIGGKAGKAGRDPERDGGLARATGWFGGSSGRAGCRVGGVALIELRGARMARAGVLRSRSIGAALTTNGGLRVISGAAGAEGGNAGFAAGTTPPAQF